MMRSILFARHPTAGLLTGCTLITLCLVVPGAGMTTKAVLGISVAVSWLFARPGIPATLRLLIAMAFIYGPMLIFIPVIAVLRGAATSIVAILTIGSMGRPALHNAVQHLPLPTTLKLLLFQILHQSSVLFVETGRIRTALTMRGAAGLRVLSALPRVWLPRVIFKANRVAHAMEMRGYGDRV